MWQSTLLRLIKLLYRKLYIQAVVENARLPASRPAKHRAPLATRSARNRQSRQPSVLMGRGLDFECNSLEVKAVQAFWR